MKKKVVLAYSGGLDTSIIIKWLMDVYDCDVVACYVDVGTLDGRGFVTKEIYAKAINTGAIDCYVVDAKEEFAQDYIFKALQAEATYENKYLLATALARPLIVKKLVDIARLVKADYICHGATGKGNDQVRFEVGLRTLAPDLRIIAPWREWDIQSRDDAMAYAKRHSIPISATKDKPYSIDENLWHVSYEGGKLEDLDDTIEDDHFITFVSPKHSLEQFENISIEFLSGYPIKLNEKALSPEQMIVQLNRLAGKHGIGLIDIVENRLVGMKSRGIYECPAATVLYCAHSELESIVLDRDTLHFKQSLRQMIGKLIYDGLWFSTLWYSLSKFIHETQKYMNGVIKLELYNGSMRVLSRESRNMLYSQDIATFGKAKDLDFSHGYADGFIKLFGFPYVIESRLRGEDFLK